jgi:hypothetical protein
MVSGIGPLEGRNDDELVLAGVVAGHDLLELAAELASHCMPPMHLGLGKAAVLNNSRLKVESESVRIMGYSRGAAAPDREGAFRSSCGRDVKS